MANPYTDPRYQMARMMRAQNTGSFSPASLGPAPSGASIKLGRAAQNMASTNPSLRAQIEAIASGKTTPERKGVAGTLLGNPLTKAVLAPLELLALPGRATVSAAREVVDMFDNNPNTKASFGDFSKNVRDKSYGFGKAFHIDTGNKWLDRAIGFAGDLALDPLTYATFGAGKFAGYTGRLDLAKAVLTHTGDERLANLVQRYGRAAIKDADVLERVGAQRHGIYFFGKRIKVGVNGQGWRLPGSGAIGQLGETALAKLRVSAMGTRGGQWLQKMTLPTEALAARRALLQGQVGDEAAGVVISYLTASPIARMTAGEAMQREEALLADFLKREANQGLDGYKTEIYKYLEKPELLATASPEIQRAAREWSDVFQWYEKQVNDAIQAADPTFEFTPVEGYFPHMHTEASFEYRADMSNPHARKLNEIYARDPLAGGGNFKSRTLREGDDWFGHTLTAAEAKDVEFLNSVARPHLNGKDFFETDITKVMPSYVREFSKEMGLLARHKHLADTGFWKRAEAVTVTGEVIDKELVDSIKSHVGSLADEMKALHRQASEAHLGLIDALNNHMARLKAEYISLVSAEGGLGAKESLAIAEAAIDDVLKGSMTLTADTLQTVVDNIGKLKGQYAALFGAEVKNGKLVLKDTLEATDDAPNMLDGLVGYLDNLQNDVQRAYDEMSVLEQDLTGQALKDAHAKADARVGLLTERLKEAQQKLKNISEFGNNLEAAVDSILKGGTLDTGNLSLEVSQILAVAGYKVGLSDSETTKLLNRALGYGGGVIQTLVGEQMQLPKGLFKELTVNSPARTEIVKKLAVKDFYDSLPKMFTGEMNLQEVREMGLWALLHDDVLHGGNVPEVMRVLREDLIGRLREADALQAAVVAAQKEASAAGKMSADKVWTSFWNDAYLRATEAQKQMGEFADTLNSPILRDVISSGRLGETITAEDIDRVVRENVVLDRLFPAADSQDELEFLMGMHDVYGTRPGQEMETVLVANDNVLDYARIGTKSNYVAPKTWGEMVERIQKHIEYAKGLMDEKVYTVGSGVGRQEFSGNEIIARANRVRGLRAAIKGRNREVASEYRRIYTEIAGRYTAEQLDTATREGAANVAFIERTARQRAANVIEERVKRQGRVLTEEMQAELKTLTGGKMKVDSRIVSGTAGVSKDQLAEAVISYTLVSQVAMRFNAVASMLQPFGLVPTEKMYVTITKSIGEKFIPTVRRQMHATNRAYYILNRLDSEIAAALADSALSGKSPSQIFKDFMAGLSNDESEILNDAIGNQIAWTADPYELGVKRKNALKGKSKSVKIEQNGKIVSEWVAAENEFFDVHVKPWFEAAFPGKTPTKKAMSDAIKVYTGGRTGRAYKKALTTPWGEGADISAIKNWFENILGESSIPGRSSKRYGTMMLGGNMGGAGMTSIPVLDVSSNIGTKLRRLSNFEKKLSSMLAIDANVPKMLQNPLERQLTPTYYTSLLRDQIEKMAQHLETVTGIKIDIANTEDIFADVQRQIEAARTGAVGMRSGILPDDLKKTIDAANAKVGAHQAWQAERQGIADELKSVEEQIKFMSDKNLQLNAKQKKELAGLRKRRDALRSKGKTLKEPEKPTAREVKLAEAGSTARPKRVAGEPVQLSPAEKSAQRVLDQYNSLISGPAYLAAQHRQQMHVAMEQLAGLDLWKYKNGFTIDGEVFASMPDGTRIVFSEEEWKSLFAGISSNEESTISYTNLTSAIREEQAKIKALQTRKADIKEAMAKASADYEAGVGAPVGMRLQRKYHAAYQGKMDGFAKQLSSTERRISEGVSNVQKLEISRRAGRIDVRNSALEKMRILVHGSDTSPAIFDEAGLKRTLEYDMPFQRAHAAENKVYGAAGVTEARSGARRVDSPLLKVDNPDMYKNIQSEIEQSFTSPRKLNVNVRLFNEASVGVSERETARRVGALNYVWKNSDEFKQLEKAAELQKNVFVIKHSQFMNDYEAMSSYLVQVQSQIENLQRKAIEAAGNATAAAEEAVKHADNALSGLAGIGVNIPDVVPIDPATATVDELAGLASNIERNIGRPGPAAIQDPVLGTSRSTEEALNVVAASAERNAAIGQRNAARDRMNAWFGEPAAPAPKTAPAGMREPLVPKQPRNVGERKILIDNAVATWKARRDAATNAQEVVDVLRDRQNVLRTQMVTASGSVEQFWKEIRDGRAVAASLQNQIDEIASIVDNLPPKDMMDVIRKLAKGTKVSEEKVAASAAAYRSWYDEAKPILERLAANPDDPVAQAYAAAHIADGQLIDIEIEHADKLLQLANASVPQWQTMVIEPLAKEYEKAAKEANLLAGNPALMGDPRMLGLRGNSEAVELLKSIDRIKEPGVVTDMARFMRGYTGFFRSYATLSPGFHVRNQISNVFSMFSGGADFANLREGFRLWRLFDNHISNGGTLGSWIATLPAEQQDVAMKAGRIMLGLGGGKTDDALEAFAKLNSEGVLRNNPAIRGSRRIGHKVEGSARFMMAYDGLVKGFDENVSFNRVKRYLIDYNEKTLLDQTMRDIVPFWTWMSRNLPLQIINRWTNPKAYLIYQRAYNNFNQDGDMTPDYMKKQMAINLGGGLHFNPDLPFTNVNEQIQGLADPAKLMGYINPGLRVPIEMLADKSFYTGQKFDDQYVKLEGTFSMLQPVLAAAGQVEYNSKGQPMVRKKAMYALMNMVPLLQRIDKLSPNDSVESASAQNSINSFLGLPFRNVSEGMMDGEKYRRLAQLTALQKKTRNIG